MKTEAQINKEIKRVKPRFNQLNTAYDLRLSRAFQDELSELGGMLKALEWVKKN